MSEQEVDLYSFLDQTSPKKAGKLKRIAVNQLSLKENFMLDEYQDNIFRMEPNKAFVLMGPPGTGKTTTLIKKLGFNLETKYSDSEEQQNWYMFDPKKITALELDILVLVFIKLIKLFKIEKEDLFRQQVFVDEITDFSTVQLSIMNNLLNDKSKTFFGAGDFNQRLTLEGVSSKDDLEWAIPKVEIEKITIPYRQSRQLTELSQLLIGKTLNEIGGTFVKHHKVGKAVGQKLRKSITEIVIHNFASAQGSGVIANTVFHRGTIIDVIRRVGKNHRG